MQLDWINGCISHFVYNDKSHPETTGICQKLENLSGVIREFHALIHSRCLILVGESTTCIL